MSNHLISEVYKRQVGNMARNAVMVLMADKASDDGSGIWASKQRMADEIGASKQTVIATIKALIEDGLLREHGQRRHANGYTIEYAINVRALRSLPLVKSHEDDQSKDLTGQASSPVKKTDPTGQSPLPHRSENLTQTPIEPSLNPDASHLLRENHGGEPDPEFTLDLEEDPQDDEALKPDHVVEAWNDLADRLGKPRVRSLTPERRARLRARIAGYSLEDFREVFGNIEASAFLRGDEVRGRSWSGCNFDWLTKKANFQKILEGNYNG